MENRFFYGIVEDRHDYLNIGRVRVRIAGMHTHDKTKLPTEDLPWAICMQANDSACWVPKEGTAVICTYTDFPDCQQPVVLGTFRTVPQENAVMIDEDPGFVPKWRDVVAPTGRDMPTNTAEKTGGGDPVTTVSSPADGQSAETQAAVQNSMIEQKTSAADRLEAVISPNAAENGVMGPLAERMQSLGGNEKSFLDKFEETKLLKPLSDHAATQSMVKEIQRLTKSDVLGKFVSGEVSLSSILNGLPTSNQKNAISSILGSNGSIANSFSALEGLQSNIGGKITSLKSGSISAANEAQAEAKKVASSELNKAKKDATKALTASVKDSVSASGVTAALKTVKNPTDVKNLVSNMSAADMTNFMTTLGGNAMSALKGSIMSSLSRVPGVVSGTGAKIQAGIQKQMEAEIDQILAGFTGAKDKFDAAMTQVGNGFSSVDMLKADVGLDKVQSAGSGLCDSTMFKKVGEGNTPPIYGEKGGPNAAGQQPVDTPPPKIDKSQYPAGANRQLQLGLPTSVYGGTTTKSTGSVSGRSITVEQIRSVAPECTVNMANTFISMSIKEGYDVEHQCMALAHAFVECHFKPVAEYSYKSAKNLVSVFPSCPLDRAQAAVAQGPQAVFELLYGVNGFRGAAWAKANLGNDQPGDGYKYRGRGMVQVTGKANYRTISTWLYKHGYTQTPTLFLDDPDSMLNEVNTVLAFIGFAGVRGGWQNKKWIDVWGDVAGRGNIKNIGKSPALTKNYNEKTAALQRFMAAAGGGSMVNSDLLVTEVPEQYKSAAENLKKLGGVVNDRGITTTEAQAAFLAVMGALCDWQPTVEDCLYTSSADLIAAFPESFRNDTTGEVTKKYLGWKAENRKSFFDYVYDPANDGKAIGNTKTGDGGLFYGAGLIHIKGRDQYERYSKLVSEEKRKIVAAGAESLVKDLDACMEVASLVFLDKMQGVVPTAHPEFFNEACRRFIQKDDQKKKAELLYNSLYGANTLSSYGVGEMTAGSSVATNDFYSGATANNGSGNSTTIGFQDPNGKYPYKRNLCTPSSGKNTSGSVKNSITLVKEQNRRTGIPMAGSKEVWDEPKSAFSAKYPYNHAQVTESGHIFEMDDTPDYERINLYHRKGTFVEVAPNGSKITRVVGDNYEIVDRNGFIYINGNANVTVGGNINILCQSSATIKVEGNTDITCGGNLDIGVAKDLNVRAQGNMNFWSNGTFNLQAAQNGHILTKGSMYVSAEGEMHTTVQSNKFDKVDGNYNSIVGGNSNTQVSGNALAKSGGEFNAYYASKIEEVGGDSELAIGGDYLIATGGGISQKAGADIHTNAPNIHVEGNSTVGIKANKVGVQAGGRLALVGKPIAMNSGDSVTGADPSEPSLANSTLPVAATKALIWGARPPAPGKPLNPNIPVSPIPSPGGQSNYIFEGEASVEGKAAESVSAMTTSSSGNAQPVEEKQEVTKTEEDKKQESMKEKSAQEVKKQVEENMKREATSDSKMTIANKIFAEHTSLEKLGEYVDQDH